MKDLNISKNTFNFRVDKFMVEGARCIALEGMIAFDKSVAAESEWSA